MLMNDPIVQEIETYILTSHQAESNNDDNKTKESYCYALHDFAGQES